MRVEGAKSAKRLCSLKHRATSRVESDCAIFIRFRWLDPGEADSEDAGRSKINRDDTNSGVRESGSSRTRERRATARSPQREIYGKNKTAGGENPGNCPARRVAEDRASRKNRAQNRYQSSPKLGYFRERRTKTRAKPRGVVGRASLTSRGAPRRCPLVF